MDAPGALLELTIEHCVHACENVMEPLFEAVARSTTLRSLRVTIGRESAECVRNTVLPAILANGSLRRVCLGHVTQPPELAAEIAAVVERVSKRGSA